MPGDHPPPQDATHPATVARAVDRSGGSSLHPADAALVAAVADDEQAPYDLDALAAEVGADRALLEAIARAGLLVAHHVDHAGAARYSAADVTAVRAGLTLLEAGLPLGELLDLGRRTDAAVRVVADHAVDAFLRFVRDPVHGAHAGAGGDEPGEAAAGTDEPSAPRARGDTNAPRARGDTADRLVTAYRVMLPATEQLVAHHTRRRLLAAAAERIAADTADTAGTDAADAP